MAVDSWLWTPGCGLIAWDAWLWTPGCGFLAVDPAISEDIWRGIWEETPEEMPEESPLGRPGEDLESLRMTSGRLG